MKRSAVTLVVATTLGIGTIGCSDDPPPDDVVAASQEALDGGEPAGASDLLAVVRVGGGCTGTYIGDRMVLTAAHCFADVARGCEPFPPTSILFAAADGEPNVPPGQIRTAIAGIAHPQSYLTSTACCGLDAELGLSTAHDMALLLLDDDPDGVTPLPVVVAEAPPVVSGVFAFPGIRDWLDTGPRVTLAGYGSGSTLWPPNNIRGRDFGTTDVTARTRTETSENCLGPIDIVTIDPIVVVGGEDAADPGPADSGGPVLAGPGDVTSTMTEPTELPTEAGLDPKRYVIGVLSAGATTTAWYPATWDPANGAWLSARMQDFDGDGIDNDFDNCISLSNSSQSNCNLRSELFHFPAGGEPIILGDRCDPVPCPAAKPEVALSEECKLPLCGAVPSGSLPQCPGLATPFVECQSSNILAAWQLCGRHDRDELGLTPLRTYDIDGSGDSSTVNFVKTFGRACQPNEDLGIACNSEEDITDDRLDDAPTADQELISHRFHRVTFSAGGPTDPNASVQLSYQFFAPDDPIVAPAMPPSWVWDHEADIDRWLTHDPPQIFDRCAGALPGQPCTPFLGMFWLHAQTGVGDASSPNPFSTGNHFDELANFHHMGPGDSGYSPSRLECYACAYVENPAAFQVTTQSTAPAPQPFPEALIWRAPVEEQARGFGRPDSRLGESDLVLRTRPDDSLFAALADPLGTGCGGLFVHDRLGPALRARLDESGRVWANTVEPIRQMGEGDTFPLAIVLSQDGSDIVDFVSDVGGNLLASADQVCTSDADCRGGICIGGFCAPRPRVGSPHAQGFVPVASRVRGGVFVVGGLVPATTQPTGEIWFTRFDSQDWHLIDTPGYAPEAVLAATYSYATDELFVLDVLAGQARLVGVQVHTRDVRQLGTWPRDPVWDRIDLVVERDGALLLASSSTSLGQYAIARIDARGAALPEVDGIEHGERALAVAPVVDAGGYSLALLSRGGWPGEALAAEGSIAVGASATVTGQVAVLDVPQPPFIGGDRALVLQAEAKLFGSALAAGMRLKKGATITDEAISNDLVIHPTAHVLAGTVTPLALPLARAVPAEPSLSHGSADVHVGSGTTSILAAGSYRDVTLASGTPGQPAVLQLAGGTYALRSLTGGDHARIECASECTVYTTGRVALGLQSYLGPSQDSELFPGSVVLLVGGTNGGPGALHVPPVAGELGPAAVVRARVAAFHGTLRIGDASRVRGTLYGRDIAVGAGADVAKGERGVLLRRRETLALEPASLVDLGDQL